MGELMNIQSVNLFGRITGQHVMSSLASALPLVGVGNQVILQPETKNVRLQYNGVPNANTGLLLVADTVYEITLGPDQSISDFQVIETEASASLNVIAISTK